MSIKECGSKSEQLPNDAFQGNVGGGVCMSAKEGVAVGVTECGSAERGET